MRPSDTKSVQTPLPTHPPPNWDRFHQQGKNLFRKEIRGKIGVNHFSYFLPFSPQGLDEWNQPILSRVLPLRLKMTWSGLGQKGATDIERPDPLLGGRTGILLEECGSGSSSHRPWSPTTWAQISDLAHTNFVTWASYLTSVCLSSPIDKMGDNNSKYLIQLWGFSELICIKCLK